MSLYLLLDVFIAFILDIFIGDPQWMPHPVKFIKWLIKTVETGFRKFSDSFSNKKIKALGDDFVHSGVMSNRNEKMAGIYFTIIMVVMVTVIVSGVTLVAYLINPIAYHVVNIYFMYSAFAARSLAAESIKVLDALKDRDVFKAGNILAMIVGRKIEHLDEQDIIRGTVETTAENTSEKVISPIFYSVIGSIFGVGAPLVYLYKTINILNSMEGYKTDKHKRFGWACAKMNVLANYFPARITGILFVVGAFVTGKDPSGSFAIMKRDKRKHHNPNSGYPEAAVAGALGIRLGGSGLYFGDIVDKPIIGDSTRTAELRDISNTINMMYAAAILGLVGFSLVFLLVFAILQII
ncbi:adenosylcobinamide-phosphate synthase CbiB [Acetivibrio cellulolyticus]|uniref:adenosylcobinamide-phosphate synthase CbiB n=1 Tax=Acetivibrio cellulolyticus TaxID=35830 RepID=UPI0001E2DEF9|nr:adenosylcobinamide-phosphate synthase CbiB [Acetivibrio cellulolyticus]